MRKWANLTEEIMQKITTSMLMLGLYLFFPWRVISADGTPIQGDYFEQGRDLKLSGIIRNYEGSLIKDATIIIPELGKATQSDKNGAFEILGIPPGKYHLEVIAEGYMDYRSELFELKSK